MAEGEAKPAFADLPPRDLTDADLQFLSDYTGERDFPALRQHVLDVWHAAKAQARCLCCGGFCGLSCTSVSPGIHFAALEQSQFGWQLGGGPLRWPGADYCIQLPGTW